MYVSVRGCVQVLEGWRDHQRSQNNISENYTDRLNLATASFTVTASFNGSGVEGVSVVTTMGQETITGTTGAELDPRIQDAMNLHNNVMYVPKRTFGCTRWDDILEATFGDNDTFLFN